MCRFFIALLSCVLMIFFVVGYANYRVLHVLTHSCPTRRSSDLSFLDRLAHLNVGRGAERDLDLHVDRGVTDPRLTDEQRARARPLEHRDLARGQRQPERSEEHTSELQSLMRISYAVFCLKKKKTNDNI